MGGDGAGRGGPGRTGGRSAPTARLDWIIIRRGDNGGVKKGEEDFDPADVSTWLRSLRLHKYTPNFEGMSWKEMLLMDEQADARGAGRCRVAIFF